MRKSRCRWSKSIGERGQRVRLYEARPGGPIMRSMWINGKENRKSLRHRDRELATRQAYDLLRALLANERTVDEGSLTLGMLSKLYLDSPQHHGKKQRTQKEDGKKLDRVVAFLGTDRNVRSLSESDVRRFAMARTEAPPAPDGVKAGRAVRNRAVEADLLALYRALNWAVRERNKTGRRLLQENPLFGVKLPKERNPLRPVMTHDEYLRLLVVAQQISPLLKLGLIVAEGTGRRLSAWRNLRWSDVDFSASTIRWRAEHDKKGFEQVVPMSDVVLEALQTGQRVQSAIGDAPVFPSPENSQEACSRYLFDAWLRRAYEKAEIQKQAGGLWHPLRRKWVTERKGYPAKDVAAAGGWRHEPTMLASYQQADAETVRKVVLHPTQRLVAG